MVLDYTKVEIWVVFCPFFRYGNYLRIVSNIERIKLLCIAIRVCTINRSPVEPIRTIVRLSLLGNTVNAVEEDGMEDSVKEEEVVEEEDGSVDLDIEGLDDDIDDDSMDKDENDRLFERTEYFVKTVK